MKVVIALLALLISSSALALVPSNAQRSRVTYDIGISQGESNDVQYTEYNLGLNWWFHPSFAWRNSIFGRNQTGVENAYGIDTSIRGNHTAEFGEASHLNIFLGPGYRFVNEGKNAPIAEGGAVLHIGGLSLGGGVKAVFNKVIDKALEDDVQYFIVLGGGGTL